YAVANMPGAVARTSTIALTNATIEYALQIANKGFRQAILDDPGLAKGVNVVDGKVTYRAVADALRLPYYSLEAVLDSRK
ncbi:MAG: alanine dehydrogenase, partial [Deltaproteobacteria bacterium]